MGEFSDLSKMFTCVTMVTDDILKLPILLLQYMNRLPHTLLQDPEGGCRYDVQQGKDS